jgi:hypothetical protein
LLLAAVVLAASAAHTRLHLALVAVVVGARA